MIKLGSRALHVVLYKPAVARPAQAMARRKICAVAAVMCAVAVLLLVALIAILACIPVGRPAGSVSNVRQLAVRKLSTADTHTPASHMMKLAASVDVAPMRLVSMPYYPGAGANATWTAIVHIETQSGCDADISAGACTETDRQVRAGDAAGAVAGSRTAIRAMTRLVVRTHAELVDGHMPRIFVRVRIPDNAARVHVSVHAPPEIGTLDRSHPMFSSPLITYQGHADVNSETLRAAHAANGVLNLGTAQAHILGTSGRALGVSADVHPSAATSSTPQCARVRMLICGRDNEHDACVDLRVRAGAPGAGPGKLPVTVVVPRQSVSVHALALAPAPLSGVYAADAWYAHRGKAQPGRNTDALLLRAWTAAVSSAGTAVSSSRLHWPRSGRLRVRFPSCGMWTRLIQSAVLSAVHEDDSQVALPLAPSGDTGTLLVSSAVQELRVSVISGAGEYPIPVARATGSSRWCFCMLGDGDARKEGPGIFITAKREAASPHAAPWRLTFLSARGRSAHKHPDRVVVWP